MSYRDLLLELRSQISYKNSNHSWSFTDEQLEDLLKVQPKTLDELGTIKGFPRDGKRVKAYGKVIISIFNNVDIDKFKVYSDDDSMIVKIDLKQSSVFI